MRPGRGRSLRSRLLVGVGALVVFGCSSLQPNAAIEVASGLISHNLCSLVFVSGLEPARAYDESIAPRPGMGFVNWAVHYDVDAAQRSVRTTVAGGGASLAIHRYGLGCLLVRGDQPPEALAAAGQTVETPAQPTRLPEIAGPAPVEPDDARLRAALDRAFADSEHGPRGTIAVVVVHDDRVIAERYAPGYGVDTPLLGYSASKSVLSALIGILVRQQRLTVEQAAPVTAWAAADDPRRAITIDQLLRMTSGLALEESGSPFCPVARMLYLERDMAGFAERAALHGEPGRTWNYTSGNTIILSRILRDAVGGHADDVLCFAHRELFDPLGMRGVTLELDATGTPVGSTYMLAPARDWARFGLLYLHDGVVAGQRILPDGWVDYSTTPTLDTGYGAGFWTNRVDGDIPWSPAPWGIPGAPRDAFYARGLLGQYVVVVPSARLVVVRFGVTHVPRQDIDGVGQLIAEVIAALPSDEARGRPGRVRGRPHWAAPTGSSCRLPVVAE